MSAHRFGGLIRNATRFFSMQSSASSPRSRPPTKFFAEDAEGGSEVYGHALKFQRPTTITLTPQLVNSVSFIGSVEFPPKISETVKLGRFGAYTLLSVKASPDSNRKFRILLDMWDEMARMCLEHLKPNDFVYVSGRLGSYTKRHEGVKLKTYYKVTVEELNYVSKSGPGPTREKVEGSHQLGAGAAGLEVHENQLHLWQVFFSNPYEWWDNRKRKDLGKVNLSVPDFKHKDTGEALWLAPNDPSWIKRQLELLDTKMAEGHGDHVGSRSCVSMWVYDE